jgi:glycosyltransferase involved in cell wall biosynthesis
MMTTDTVGGVWVYATGLAQRLAEQGVRVTLVTLGPPPNGPTYVRARALSPRVELIVTNLSLEWIDPEGNDLAHARSTLLQIAEGISPDVIHLNGFREGAFDWPCPVLVAAHSCVWSWWQATHGRAPAEPRWEAYREAAAAGLRGADAWVAPTAAFRDIVQQLYRPRRNGWLIPNGIDLSNTPPAVGKRRVILASGRIWDQGKNLVGLARAAGGLPWRVEIAGGGAMSLGDACVRNVNWLGELDHNHLQERMRRAAVYAAPALYEPFGLGILEAAAAGCALVLSDIESLRELWDGAALFVPVNRRDELRTALLQVCANDVLRARLQRAALARAQRYSLDRTIAEYLKLYGAIQQRAKPADAVGQELPA